MTASGQPAEGTLGGAGRSASVTRQVPLWVGRIGFAALAIAIALAYAALLRGQITYGLEYDESYLLEVIDSIASGNGFVDDGVSFFTSGLPFDPNISTGPVLLLPSALVWAISDGSVAATRLVPIAFFVVYLIASSVLFYRWRGRWAVLAALVGPLIVVILMPDLTNRSVMPGRIVGETAATALLMVMAVLLARRRLAWAGLAGGLAIQTKLNFALPVAALLAIWIVGSWLAHRGPTPRSLARLVPGLVLPTLLFEGYKALTLGISGYANNIELTRAFSAFNTVSASDIPNSTLAKLASVTQLLSGPAVVLGSVALAVLVLRVLLDPYLSGVAPQERTRQQDDDIALVAALGGAFSFLLWWVLVSSQTSPRPAVPVLMLALSMVSAAMLVTAIEMAARAHGRLGGAARLLPVLVVGILVLCTFYQGVRIHRNDSGEGLKASQEQAAAVILANADALPIDDFWTNPEFSVLTGLPYHSDSRVNSSLLVYTSIRALTEHGRPDATIYTEMCGVVLFASTDVLVCTPTSRPE